MDAPRARQQHASWALFLALVPMLTFMGHWPRVLPIPGTDSFVYVPLAGASHEAEGHHDHSKHCHGDAASCTDAPAAAGVTNLLMHALVSLPGVTAVLFLGLLATVPAPAGSTIAPELRPPRAIAAA